MHAEDVAAALFSNGFGSGFGALGSVFFINLRLYPFSFEISLKSIAETVEISAHTTTKAKTRRSNLAGILSLSSRESQQRFLLPSYRPAGRRGYKYLS